ncbi:hypothetical protein NQ317_016114 [Molorchus minor]|uniref:THAP-type domain-containing protein n=1 Tax=Molorchus minor TaxID=1323400 RepID=A0ABQ9IU33_9CUCU|nr:hypothetical protein NQ317_016114 [Molorchus minor]
MFEMASRSRLCHVCGSSEDEVAKLHYFPSQLERSKIWQYSMGMCYTGETLKNFRICSRHFTDNSYVDLPNRKLARSAVPTLFSCQAQQTQVRSGTQNVDGSIGSEVCTLIDIASTSKVVRCQLVEKSPAIARPSRENFQEIPNISISELKSVGRKRSLFRGIDNLSRTTATPRKVKLMDMVCRKEDQIRKLKVICKERANDIKALSNIDDSTVVRNLFEGMSTTTSDFLISQLRCAKRDPKGRRWTIEEKVVALALLKRSPKCYKLLSKIVAMPSKRTLTSLLEKVTFSVGINEYLFEHINHSLISSQDKLCVLLFDEMDIKANVQYDASSDRIIGFEDFGDHSSPDMANKALVFMCQGLSRPWKQPVAYYFSSGVCSTEKLSFCIKQVIHAAKDVGGLDIVATICDMGSTNVNALKSMGVSISHPYFECDGSEVYAMFDIPHLVKCIASLFRKHNVKLPVEVRGQEVSMEARFSDVREAYEVDKKSPLIFRALPKIKDRYMAPIMRFAMKVNIAAQTMSRTVASFIYTLVSRGELEQRAIASATFIQQVDELFDSFNGNQEKRS